MIDAPPVPLAFVLALVIALIGWGTGILVFIWRVSSETTLIKSDISAMREKLAEVKSEVNNDIAGRRAFAALSHTVTDMKLAISEIKTRSEGRDETISYMRDVLDELRSKG
jgi:hypothetical protein